MNKLMMKARAGVTLVELLVVILIVTILSVSMLPLLQPFVTEAQYAAEAIPVIGNLRTKIGLYQYDKAYLPHYANYDNYVSTWLAGVSGKDSDGNVVTGDSEKYTVAYYELKAEPNKAEDADSAVVKQSLSDADLIGEHVGRAVDVDYEDLKGKRSKPTHYQYYAISPSNNCSYVVACFGDGSGLKAGTGYAVCELNFTKAQKKYIGTWKRYKPVTEDSGSILFGSQAPTDNSEKLSYCYVPSSEAFQIALEDAATGTDKPSLITDMELAGWEF